jgi:hypothetical protein
LSLRPAPVAPLLALALAGCSLLNRHPSDSPAELAARAAENLRIQHEVEARLAAEPALGSAHLRVEARDGEVGLFGNVSGSGALRCAERNAELVRGVRLVIDHLVLDPGPREVRCLSPRVVAGTRVADHE